MPSHQGREFFLKELNRQGAYVPVRRKTPVYGDTNGFGQRVQAGSRSDKGGIRSGDSIPYPRPWVRAAPIAPDRLPQLLWEGTLTDGQNTVLIAPMAWEEDTGDWLAGAYSNISRTAGDLYKIFGTLGPSTSTGSYERTLLAINEVAQTSEPVSALSEFLKAINPANWPGAVAGWLGKQITWVVGVAADRPIGQTPVNDQYVFMPKVLALNYITGEKLLATPPPAPPAFPGMQAASAVFGKPVPVPAGVFQIRLKDDDRLAGDYVLWVHIERI
jgi:hypothetical protein